MTFGKAVLISSELFIATNALDEQNLSRADPLPPADFREALFDNACAHYVAAILSNAEAARKEIPGWIRLCNTHPDASVCRQATETIVSAGKSSSLSCGSASGSNLAAFDEACANVTAALLGKTGAQHQTQLPGWIKTCSAHPEATVCRDATDLIGKASPLSCGSSN